MRFDTETCRKALRLAISVLTLTAGLSLHAMQRVNMSCTVGGQYVVTQGLKSTAKYQASYPGCTVTVYLSGTTTKAQLFSNNLASPSVKPNPFAANTDGSASFYAPNGRYDVVMSGAGFPQPVTISDVLLQDTGGSSGGSGTAYAPFIAAFSGATTVSIPSALHMFSTIGLVVQCYDANAPAFKVEPSSLAINSSTRDVTVKFAVAQTGYCLVNGGVGPTGAAGTNGTNGTNGTPGAAATVTVGSTSTGAAGTNAAVTNSGTSSAAILNFTIPRGATGDAGATGPANTLTIGTVTTLASGEQATATVTGSAPNQTLNLGIPQGASGSGTGTVNSGTANQIAYYATSTNAVSGTTILPTTAMPALSGDCTLTAGTTNTLNCTKTGGTNLGSLATASTGTGVTVSAGTLTTLGQQPYNIKPYIPGTFASSQVLYETYAEMAFTVPLTGAITSPFTCTSQFKLDTAPANNMTFTLTKNGSSFGTIAVSAGATTGTFTISASTAFVVGDKFGLVAQSTVDASGAGAMLSLCGVR